MKGLSKILPFFYIIFPLIYVPFIASKAANWFYLFGIVCYYLGIFLVAIRQKIIFMIPIIFCCWFWYTYGFSIHDFVFFLLGCMAAGAIFYQLSVEAEKFTHRTLPENKEALDYDLKIEEMNIRQEKYKQQHPEVTITPEIMDSIKNDVFFK